jgi:hypothetical protein
MAIKADGIVIRLRDHPLSSHALSERVYESAAETAVSMGRQNRNRANPNRAAAVFFCAGARDNLVCLLPPYEHPFAGAVVGTRLVKRPDGAVGPLKDAQNSPFILSSVEIDEAHHEKSYEAQR